MHRDADPTVVRYQHRQTGWPIVAGALLPFVFAVARLLAPQPRPPGAPLGPALVLVSVVLLVGFSSLSVTVTRDRLVARFGVGLVRRTIALDDIVDVQLERTRWVEGWGIHFTRRGMLYNVGGFDVVALRLAGGRRVRIGSDDVERLAAAVRHAVAERRRTRPSRD